VNALERYYAANGNWEGVQDSLASSPQLAYYSRSAVLADAQGNVVIGDGPFPAGRALPQRAVDESTVLNVNGQTVGYVHFTPINEGFGGPGRPPPPPNETALINRVIEAALVSAAIAALTALLLGVVLARTLTRPIRELTAATKAMATGDLSQQVSVHSRDEIGELANAFNHMSADLARASQSRKQMTADLAHDLRTPLTILRGYTEGLKEGRVAGSPRLYGVMHGEVEHLQRLVEDLRTLSLADAGEMRLNKRAVDPKALLERTVLAYFMQAEQQGIALRVEAADGLPSISVDTDRMTQVLNNLVTNALRHTARGEIVLSACVANGRIQLKVRDTGAGIAPEDAPYVFDRFYRSDKSRQRMEGDDDSSGLGLAIAKAIVETHGGSISVESAPGRGTTFIISL
jgi:two-component system sensor histidine kinase BaeS